MTDRSTREALWLLREQVYASFEARRDALFELLDAVMVAGLVPSVVHLSLAALHRRGWGSLYGALANGVLDVANLRRVVAQYPLDDGAPMYAVDTSAWARCDAECSPQRGYYHHPSRHSAGKPIVAGWSYSWLAQLSLKRDSWTAPLDVRRVPPASNAHTTAVEQIADLLNHQASDAPVATFVFDGGYDPVRLARELGHLDATRVAVLVRLRRDRCFYADPPPRNSTHVGRPVRHGQKFACRDHTTWPGPTDTYEVEDTQYGTVRVRAWSGLHAKTQNHPDRGTWMTKALVSGTLLLVEVSRLPTTAFDAATQESADAMMVLGGRLFGANRAQLTRLAAEHRIPALYADRPIVADGGLMGYAFVVGGRGPRAAEYVFQILHGANPGDLPMGPPPETELVVNLQAAQEIGYAFPPSVLARATEIIR